jgi:heme/copper-type cytochrome/quinol oxidase subunit 1
MTSIAEAGSIHSRISFYEVPRGILSWIFTLDHKRIGLLYLIFVIAFFFTGVILGFFMRLEMVAPGGTMMGPQTYNALFTLHGIIMIFLVVIPVIPTVFGNFFLPIQIGARDVAFPRINLLSWWLYISGAIIVLFSVFTGGGPPDTGWTFYAPYSLRTTVNVPLAVFGVFILGMSSILTGINLVTTTHRLRAPGMTWGRLPLFVWGIYATSWVQILATPVIGITMVLVFLERLRESRASCHHKDLFCRTNQTNRFGLASLNGSFFSRPPSLRILQFLFRSPLLDNRDRLALLECNPLSQVLSAKNR